MPTSCLDCTIFLQAGFLSGSARVLDLALELGLMVMVGLWVHHERHGQIAYNSGEESCQKQLAQEERLLKDVRRLKNHPAVLCWVCSTLFFKRAELGKNVRVGIFSRSVDRVRGQHAGSWQRSRA